jgi:hypothetical protein
MARVDSPGIRRVGGEYEFFGWSFASGEVGGDLVDVVDADGRWLADVLALLTDGFTSRVAAYRRMATAPPRPS